MNTVVTIKQVWSSIDQAYRKFYHDDERPENILIIRKERLPEDDTLRVLVLDGPCKHMPNGDEYLESIPLPNLIASGRRKYGCAFKTTSSIENYAGAPSVYMILSGLMLIPESIITEYPMDLYLSTRWEDGDCLNRLNKILTYFFDTIGIPYPTIVIEDRLTK